MQHVWLLLGGGLALSCWPGMAGCLHQGYFQHAGEGALAHCTATDTLLYLSKSQQLCVEAGGVMMWLVAGTRQAHCGIRAPKLNTSFPVQDKASFWISKQEWQEDPTRALSKCGVLDPVAGSSKGEPATAAAHRVP
jgi:hypothetical protein